MRVVNLFLAVFLVGEKNLDVCMWREKQRRHAAGIRLLFLFRLFPCCCTQKSDDNPHTTPDKRTWMWKLCWLVTTRTWSRSVS